MVCNGNVIRNLMATKTQVLNLFSPPKCFNKKIHNKFKIWFKRFLNNQIHSFPNRDIRILNCKMLHTANTSLKHLSVTAHCNKIVAAFS